MNVDVFAFWRKVTPSLLSCFHQSKLRRGQTEAIQASDGGKSTSTPEKPVNEIMTQQKECKLLQGKILCIFVLVTRILLPN